jgi:hypothetical protein
LTDLTDRAGAGTVGGGASGSTKVDSGCRILSTMNQPVSVVVLHARGSGVSGAGGVIMAGGRRVGGECG